MGVPADDRGFTLGDGLFETLLAVEGRLLNFDAHCERLHRGCEALGLPKPAPLEVRAEAEAALATVAAPRVAVRVTLTAGSGGRGLDRPETPGRLLIATAAPVTPPERPPLLVTSPIRRNDFSPTSRLKTLSYLDNVLARQEARLRGGNEALMVNSWDLVTCATAANLFWIAGDDIFTPDLDCGALDGTVRAALLARVPVQEVKETRITLDAADAIFLTNSLIGVSQVWGLDGRLYERHPRIPELQALVADIVPPL